MSASELAIVAVVVIIAIPVVGRLFPQRPRIRGRAMDVTLGFLLAIGLAAILGVVAFVALMLMAR